MIFLTAGTQLPFDRLIESVDNWNNNKQVEINAQVAGGKYVARNLNCVNFITAEEFDLTVKRAELVIAHAGIGVILTARKFGIPVIVMPRRVEFREHRNDHQLATAKYLGDLSGVYVAEDEECLHGLLDIREELESRIIIDKKPEKLIERLQLFVEKGV